MNATHCTYEALDELNQITCRDYDERIVKVLMQRFKIAEVFKFAMLYLNHRRTGRKMLTMDGFAQFFPTFPMYLQTTWITNLQHEHPVSALFNRFGDLRLVENYDDQFADLPEYAEGKFTGLIVDWPHLRMGGGLVLHNHPINAQVPGTRMLYISRTGFQLVLEPLSVLLDSIDCAFPGGWQPEPEPDMLAQLPPRLAAACHKVLDTE